MFEIPIEIITDDVMEKLEKCHQLLTDIINMRNEIISCGDDEKKAKAIQSAIDFKTKSAIQYVTYEIDGDKVLALVNTEDNSTINFKVDSVIGGIDFEKFHPEKMFKPAKSQ